MHVRLTCGVLRRSIWGQACSDADVLRDREQRDASPIARVRASAYARNRVEYMFSALFRC